MRCAKLTATDGTSVWVVPTWVQKVRKTVGSEVSEGSTFIQLSGGYQIVREQPNEVRMRLGLED